MAAVKGYFDAKTRAFVEMVAASGQRAHLQIDTGFNGAVLIGDLTAQRLGVSAFTGYEDVQPAGSAAPFRVGMATLDASWLSRTRRIDVMVWQNEVPKGRGEPDGLLGTGLIHPGKLLLDYINGIVELSD